MLSSVKNKWKDHVNGRNFLRFLQCGCLGPYKLIIMTYPYTLRRFLLLLFLGWTWRLTKDRVCLYTVECRHKSQETAKIKQNFKWENTISPTIMTINRQVTKASYVKSKWKTQSIWYNSRLSNSRYFNSSFFLLFCETSNWDIFDFLSSHGTQSVTSTKLNV